MNFKQLLLTSLFVSLSIGNCSAPTDNEEYTLTDVEEEEYKLLNEYSSDDSQDATEGLDLETTRTLDQDAENDNNTKIRLGGAASAVIKKQASVSTKATPGKARVVNSSTDLSSSSMSELEKSSRNSDTDSFEIELLEATIEDQKIATSNEATKIRLTEIMKKNKDLDQDMINSNVARNMKKEGDNVETLVTKRLADGTAELTIPKVRRIMDGLRSEITKTSLEIPSKTLNTQVYQQLQAQQLLRKKQAQQLLGQKQEQLRQKQEQQSTTSRSIKKSKEVV